MMLETLIVYILSHWLRLIFANMVDIGILLRNLLSRDILAVLISTVASESTFSTSGRTLNPVRNSLSNESIEALVCDQD
jgi:hAT family C-terminal dimerisation region